MTADEGALEIPDAKQIPGGALARLAAGLEPMSAAERRAASFVLEHPRVVATHSIQHVAHVADTSEASFVRMARRAGFDSFSELKRGLLADVAGAREPLPSSFSPGDDSATLLTKVVQNDARLVSDTLDLVDEGAFTQGVALIRHAPHVVVWATGASLPFGQYLYQRVMRSGIQAVLESNPYEQVVQASYLTKETVLIVVSRTAWPQMLIEACDAARDRGVRLLVITGQAHSYIGQIADVVLQVAVRELHPEILTSGVGFIAVVDALYAAITLTRE